MSKRLISIILALAFLSDIFLLFTPRIMAEEVTEHGYIEVSVDGKKKKYIAINQKDEIYLNANDLSEITGYDVDIHDRIIYIKENNLDDVTNVEIEFDGTTYAMGKQYKMTVIHENGSYFLPINQIFYLLHAQWCMEDGGVTVSPLPYTLIDFIEKNYKEMLKNRANQTDLLINGQGKGSFVIQSSLNAVFNDFDPMMFIPWWPGEGSVPALNKEYEEALLQLVVDDKEFLDSYGQQEITKKLEEGNIGKGEIDNAKLFLDLNDTIKDGNQQIDFLMEQIKKQAKNKNSVLFNKYADISLVTPDDIKAMSEGLGYVSDTLSFIKMVMTVSEIEQRAQTWGPEFLDQLGILTDFDDTGYNKVVVERIKRVASNLLEQYYDPISAENGKIALMATSEIIGKIADRTLLGKILAINNAAAAIAKINPDVRQKADAYDLSYMVDCLIKTEHIAMREMMRSYEKIYLNKEFNEEDLSRLRKCAVLTIRTNLRNHAFIYYLNEKLNDDVNWTSSDQAWSIKEQIINDYVLLCEIMETDPCDQLLFLKDFDKIYNEEYGMLRIPITTDIFHEGELSDTPITLSDLLDGYWRENIQTCYIYKFRENGIVDVYEEGGYEGLSYSYSVAYRLENKYLYLDTNKLEMIPGNTGWYSFMDCKDWYFIESGWKDSGEPSDQPHYLMKETDPINIIQEKGKTFKVYRYLEGEYVSHLSIGEGEDGNKYAYLGFWYNYGDSSSTEDFYFEWHEGQTQYETVEQRTKEECVINITPVSDKRIEEGLRIKITYKNTDETRDDNILIDEVYTFFESPIQF